MRVEISKEIVVEFHTEFRPVKSSPGTYRPEFSLACTEENSGEEKTIKLTAKQAADVCDAISVSDNGVVVFDLTPDDCYSTEGYVCFDEDVITELVEEAWGIK